MSSEDHELLERWRRGDEAAGEVLFERYYGPVERFFINKVNEEVADLVQETFAACVQGHGRADGIRNFRSYLFSVAYNVLCQHLRQRYREQREIDFDEASISSLSPSASSVIAHREQERLLLEGLRGIPVRDQMILELYYWEHLTTAQIADVISVPHSTARTRLQRSRTHLAAAIQRLTNSRSMLESTQTSLDDWARGIRELLHSSDDVPKVG